MKKLLTLMALLKETHAAALDPDPQRPRQVAIGLDHALHLVESMYAKKANKSLRQGLPETSSSVRSFPTAKLQLQKAK